MISFAVRRLAAGLVVMVLVVVFLTLVTHLVAGDPARVLLGPQATPEVVAEVRAELHLGEPVPKQVWAFLTGIVHGDLGTHSATRQPVTTLVGDAVGNTLVLAITSLLLAAAFGIPLGVASAARPGSWYDRLTGVLSVAMISVPAYVVALLLVLLLTLHLGWLPGSGSGSLTGNPADYFHRLLLPAVSLAAGWTGYIARLLRSSMLEVLESDYVLNARSFGLSKRVILYRYALRNALVPVVAVLGSALGYLAAGTIVIEQIFNRPGLGYLLVSAVQTREWSVVRGCALIFTFLFVFGNVLAEVGVRALDPRVSLRGRSVA